MTTTKADLPAPIQRFTTLGHRRPDGELVLYDDHRAMMNEALAVIRFYANQKTYEGGHECDGGHAAIDIDRNGDLARAFIAKVEGK